VGGRSAEANDSEGAEEGDEVPEWPALALGSAHAPKASGLGSALVRVDQQRRGLTGEARVMRRGDVLEELVEQLIVVAGLDRRAALAVDRDLDAVSTTRSPHGRIVGQAREVGVNGGLDPGEVPGPNDSIRSAAIGAVARPVAARAFAAHRPTSFQAYHIDNCQYGWWSIYSAPP
jgi:hypothetical protein